MTLYTLHFTFKNPVLKAQRGVKFDPQLFMQFTRRKTSAFSNPSYYSALAFTQYDPFGHSYSAMLDLCISMLYERHGCEKKSNLLNH